MSDMTQQEISEFLAENHVAHIATVRPDGRPHVTPVSYVADLMGTGMAYIIAPLGVVKFRNVRQNPNVSLSIANDQQPYDYVVLEGEGRLTEDNLSELLERMCLRYFPGRGPKYPRELLAGGGLLVLEIRVNKVLSRKSDPY